MRSINYSLSAIMLLFISCRKEVLISPPVITPKLVVNGITYLHDTIEVQIGKSSGTKQYDGHKESLNVSEATVQLFINGTFSETLNYRLSSKSYISAAVVQEGKEYCVRVTAPSFIEVTAKFVIPSVVSIMKIGHTADARKDAEGKMLDELNIIFNDPPAPGDIYRVRFIRKSTTDKGEISQIVLSSGEVNKDVLTLDPSVESADPVGDDPLSSDVDKKFGYDDIIIRDILFNGITKTLKLYVPSSESWAPGTRIELGNNDSLIAVKDTMFVELSHIPETYYHFLKSSGLANSSSGGVYTEPTNVTTNISNGYGIFTAVSRNLKAVN